MTQLLNMGTQEQSMISYSGHCQFCHYKYRNEKGGVSKRIHGRAQIVW